MGVLESCHSFNPRFRKSKLQNEENSYKASFHRHLNTEYLVALRKNAKSYQQCQVWGSQGGRIPYPCFKGDKISRNWSCNSRGVFGRWRSSRTPLSNLAMGLWRRIFGQRIFTEGQAISNHKKCPLPYKM